MAKGVPILGKDPLGKAKYANVTESGDLKVQLSGTVASELRLYDRGYEAVPLVKGIDVGETKLTKNSDHILLEAENPSGVSDISIVTDTTIPLDGVQFIVVDWEQQSTARLARASLVVRESKNGSYNVPTSTHVSGVGRRISVLDVSDLNGSYYVRVHAVDTSAISAKSVVRVNRLLAVSYEPGHIPIFVDDVTKKPYLPVKDTETVYKWLSNEAKPTIGIPYLAFGLEVDTGTIYYWDGMKWEVYNV